MPLLEYDNRLKSKQILKAGTSLSLQVNISGIPSPMVTWLFDDAPIEKSARLSIDTTEEVSTITVKNALLDDGGVYSIIAKNDVGEAKAEFDVIVKGLFCFIIFLFNLLIKFLTVKTWLSIIPKTTHIFMKAKLIYRLNMFSKLC